VIFCDGGGELAILYGAVAVLVDIPCTE